jgi:hypothetical protein
MSAFDLSLYIPGFQPHPTLPIFVTYGIDSTAKLWRATSPVDMDVDDSDLGRYNYHSKQVKYQKSIVVDQWKKVFNGKEASEFSLLQNIPALLSLRPFTSR